MKSFWREESGNITLWILYILFIVLLSATWIIIFEIIQTYIFPLAVTSGAANERPFIYMRMFLMWFPLVMILGVSMYAILNSQRPEQGGY